MIHAPQAQDVRHPASGFLGILWRLLTEPSPEFEEIEVRRRVRFLLALLVVIVPLGMVGNLLSHFATSPTLGLLESPGFVTILSADVILTAAYFLGRTKKYYVLAATLTLIMITATSLVAVGFAPEEADTLLIFLAMDVLLASLLLSLRGTFILAVANTLSILFLQALVPALTMASVTNALIYVSIMSILILVSANIRQRDLDRIEGQAFKLGEMYTEVEAHATELQRINNRVAAILNSVGEGLVVVSLKGRIEQVNPAFEEQTGYAGHEVLNRHHEELLLGSQLPRATEDDAYLTMDAGQVWRGELPVERKDGTLYDAAVTVAPVRSDAGEVIAFAVSVRDITELKEVERMQDAFVSNVTHELRTPISSLKIYLKLLETATPSDLKKYVPILERETDRLHHIIEDVLRLSRLDQGRTESHMTQVDLNRLVSEYVEDRVPLARKEGLALTMNEKEADLPPVEADEGWLGQVLSILLTNAMNYTPEGGRVNVSTQVEFYGGRKWSGFSVSDTGPGIPPDEQQELFKRFFRGHSGRDARIPGTGLGLAIAKEILGLHGGRIEVASESVPGQGATFFVWLPSAEN